MYNVSTADERIYTPCSRDIREFDTRSTVIDTILRLFFNDLFSTTSVFLISSIFIIFRLGQYRAELTPKEMTASVRNDSSGIDVTTPVVIT